MSLGTRRHLLGGLALVLLAAAALLLLGNVPRLDENLRQMYGGICLRAGLTLGATWLAFWEVKALLARCSPRLLLTLALGGMALIVRPRAFPIVLLLFAVVVVLEIVGWMLKPLRSSDRTPKR